MNETLRTIYSLNSTHGNFSNREISDQELQTIINASVRAATASARQSYSVIVVSNREEMKEYLQYEGSKALVFCVDHNRLIDTADYLNLQHGLANGDLLNFITASTDTILAAQTAAIAAKSLGIDSLFTNSIHRKDLAKFYEHFELPQKHCFPLIALILGYASGEHQVTRGRLSGPGVIHDQKYRRATAEQLQEVMAAYDDPVQNMGLIFHRKNPEPSSYFDWFFKVWCKPNSQETYEKKLTEIYQFLIRAGFMDSKYL